MLPQFGTLIFRKTLILLKRCREKLLGGRSLIIHPQSSVTTMMEDLKWEPLANRRKSAKLGLFHKIHHNNVELDFKRDFDLSYATRMTRACSSISADGHTSSHKLHRPRANKRPFQHATIVSTVPAWNSLSPEQIILPYTQFKKQLSSVRRP